MTRPVRRVAFGLTVCLALGAAQAQAVVKPNHLFSNGAVLQQGMPAPVWGTAADGEKVTVTFADQTVSTVARDGKWLVRLAPMRAGGPFTMTIAGENTVTLHGILVGEVWVASGQSNMDLEMYWLPDVQQIMAASRDPELRILEVVGAKLPAAMPEVGGRWRKAQPDGARIFAAVPYFFGRELRHALGVPVGIIKAAVGGTAAEWWTRRAVLENDPRLKDLVPSTTGALYEAMIAPLQPYAIRGVIWYQGESNIPAAFRYRTLFPAMINSWRQDWGRSDLPFLFVQIAPYGPRSVAAQESAQAELREAQLLTSQRVANTAMVVITDLGDENDIHPRQKAPVGARLALAALGAVYGRPIVYSGPIYKSMQVVGRDVILAFDHVGGGLVAKGGALTGFRVAGEDRKFYKAEAMIRGRAVVVSSSRVEHPIAVRYGWADFPVVNLYNREGLPASPFRTDDFPMVTAPK